MVKVVEDLVIDGVGLDKIQTIVSQLIHFAEGSRIWLFEGDLGAGKTIFIKEICTRLGVEDNVSSPTFSIINEYISAEGPVYHFDFFRIKNLEEAMNAGIEEYFFSGSYCFIEWPELVVPILPSEYLKISIEAGTGEERRYKLTHYGTN